MNRRVATLVALALLALGAALYFRGGDDRPPSPTTRGDDAAPAATPVAPAAATVRAATVPDAATTTADQRTDVAAHPTFVVQGRAVRGVDQPVPGARVRARAF